MFVLLLHWGSIKYKNLWVEHIFIGGAFENSGICFRVRITLTHISPPNSSGNGRRLRRRVHQLVWAASRVQRVSRGFLLKTAVRWEAWWEGTSAVKQKPHAAKIHEGG